MIKDFDRDDGHGVLALAISWSCSRPAISIPSSDLAKHAGGRQAGQPCQVDRGLGVPRSAEHAPLLGDQREQVPGLDEIVGPRGRVDDRANRPARSSALMPVRHDPWSTGIVYGV